MHRNIHRTETNEYFMLFTTTGEPNSSVNTGAVIGGTILGFIFIALMALVIFLLYKKTKRRKFYIRYMVIQYTF